MCYLRALSLPVGVEPSGRQRRSCHGQGETTALGQVGQQSWENGSAVSVTQQFWGMAAAGTPAGSKGPSSHVQYGVALRECQWLLVSTCERWRRRILHKSPGPSINRLWQETKKSWCIVWLLAHFKSQHSVAHRASSLYAMKMWGTLANSTWAFPHSTPESECLFWSHTNSVKLVQENEKWHQ